MKTLFIPTYRKTELTKESLVKLHKLPKNIAIAYSIQYKPLAEEIRKELLNNKSNKHNIVNFNQVLGCSKLIIKKEIQAILLIGSGKFHAISLKLQTKIPVYLYEEGSLKEIEEKETEVIKKRRKAAYAHFLNSKTFGILVSSKPGQYRIKKAIELKNKLEKKGKTCYIFISNNINIQEFENFNDIDFWINTACPRLEYDSSKIINIEDISSI